MLPPNLTPGILQLRNDVAGPHITARRSPAPSASRVLAAAAPIFFLFGSSAFAVVTEHVRDACKADYYQHCSQFSVGTDELRQCMRKVGEGLSTPCLVALVEAGEITQADIDRHNAQKGAGTAADPPGAVKMPKKPGDLKNADTKHDKKNVAGAANDGKKAAKGQAVDAKGKTAKTAKASKNSKSGKSKLSKSGPKTAIAAKGATAAKTTKSADAKKTTKKPLAASGKSAGKTTSRNTAKAAKLTGAKEAAKTKKSAKNGASKKTASSAQKAAKPTSKQVAKPSAKKINKTAEEPAE
jgi:hypothetical protein